MAAPETTGSLTVPKPAPSSGIDPRGMRVIWLLLIAAFVAILNETTMAIAIPHLNEDLGLPPELGQWLTSAFMLTMAVVIPTTGFLLLRFTTRQIFLAAIISFSLGTLLCLVAPGFPLLLLGRIVQAAGTGVMLPLLMTTVMNVVPAHSRGRIMGRVGLVIAFAPALGPTLSGAVLEALSWRWLFAIILPIAIVAMLIGAKWMTNLGETTRAPIDVLSIILSALGFGGLVFGLSEFGGGHGGESGGGEGDGGSGALPWIMLTVGAIGLVLFVLRQFALQRKDDALLDLRIFRSGNFTVSVVIMAVVAFAMLGTFSLLPLYLQTVAGLNSLLSGLVLLPGALLMGLLGPVMGRVYDARGPKTLLIPGTILIAAAMFFYSTVGESTPYFVLVSVQIMMSLGLAGSFTPLFSASLGSLERRLYSHGSAALNTMQQVAGAAGTALLISIYSSILHAGQADGLSEAAAGEPGTHAAFFVAGCVALVPIVLAFFVRKPVESGETPVAAH
ncbi:MDR family MFS transporter [Microbacterium sp.]|uniref:MDR family MFS transporter n=1 Tax=Microbacterium sp. TaxID=51671 RepID=UPI003F95D9C5